MSAILLSLVPVDVVVGSTELIRGEPFVVGVPAYFSILAIAKPRWESVMRLRRPLILELSTRAFELDRRHITTLLPLPAGQISESDGDRQVVSATPRRPGEFQMAVSLIWNFSTVVSQTVHITIVKPEHSSQGTMAMEPDSSGIESVRPAWHRG